MFENINQVICNFNMFDIEQTVYVYADNAVVPIAKCAMEELGEVITSICFNSNANKVHLFGNEKYVDTILRDIDLHSGSAYSNGTIQVEVN